jgi:hypothetical protein
MMKVLELFAGSCSFSKAAQALGHKTFCVDVEPFDNIDLVKDVEELLIKDIPFKPDIIWASPPCQSYSICGCAAHRKETVAHSEFGKKSDKLVIKTLEFIKHYDCVFYIENPRAILRKMHFMKGIPRATVWYCKYGDSSAKPTDIFTNNLYSLFNPNGWRPRAECRNGNIYCHHEPAPRGSKTGTQGKKNAYFRSMVPQELCDEILNN